MSLIIQNMVLFQLGWFCCVIGGASSEYSLLGVVVVSVIVAIHLLRAANAKREALLILATMIIGTSWDSGLLLSGMYSFSHGVVIEGIVPLWLIAMWALFATTLNVSLRWMKQRYLLAAVFGLIGGPVAYYAGQQLGAVAFSDTSLVLLTVGIGWSVIMPVLVSLTGFFDGYSKDPAKYYEVKSL